MKVIPWLLKQDIVRHSIAALVKKTNRGKNFIDKNCPQSYQTAIDYNQTEKINIDTALHIEKQIFLYGCFDPEAIDFANIYLSPAAIILDIGANSGALSLGFASHLNKDGHIYAFEPGCETANRFQENLTLNPHLQDKITLIRCGLGANEKTFFRKESDPPGNGTLMDETGALLTAGEPVQITTLDRWLEETQLSAIDFMKVDVEGFELAVFQGGVKALEQFHPTIWFESTQISSGGRDRVAQCYQFLESLGYQIFNPAILYPTIPVYGNYPQDSLAIHKSQASQFCFLQD